MQLKSGYARKFDDAHGRISLSANIRSLAAYELARRALRGVCELHRARIYVLMIADTKCEQSLMRS